MSNDLLRGAWKHGPFSLDNPKACAASYCCPCIQYGMTDHAMGHNFLFACCCSLCLPLCSTIIQRQAVAKHSGITSNLLEDIGLSCCCPCCVTAQCAMQMGDKADITNFKVDYLFKAPTKQEIEHQAHDATSNAAGAKTDNPLAK